MRFSPALMAVFAASATLGFSNPARGQAVDAEASVVVETSQLESAPSEVDTSLLETPSPEVISVEPESTPSLALEPLEAGVETEGDRFEAFQLSRNAELQLFTSTELAQAGSPPPGTQGPDQETPNQIEFEVRPDGSEPQIEISPELERRSPTFEDTAPEDESAPEGEIAPEFEAVPEGSSPAPSPAGETPDTAAPTAEARVLVSELDVRGVAGNPAEAELLDAIYGAARTAPGRPTTQSQLQEDINAIFRTGYFSNVTYEPENTPLGVRVTFVVQPNPILRQVTVTGEEVLPDEVVEEAFEEQYGEILNFRDLQRGIQQVNDWYQENGYVLAQVIDAPQVGQDGVVTLEVAEGEIEDVQVRFLSEDGELTDENDEPIKGKTRPFIVTRELQLEPGKTFNRTQVEEDLRRVFGLGIFEDVRLSLEPGQDPRKVVVVVNVIERDTGSIAAGAGFSSASGLFGSVSYQEQNLGGNNQKLGAEVQVGVRELLFDVNFTDPWIAGDPYRTSYTVNAFRRRSISLIFDGGENEVTLPNEDRPRVTRTGGGVSFTRPLDDGWTLSLGGQYQRVSIRDADGDLNFVDELGNVLSFDDDGTDDILSVQFGGVRDRRNDRIRPTQGSLLRLGVEQTVPLGGILFNRLRGSYSYYMPVRFTNFTAGCRQEDATPSDCPQALAFNVQAGTVLGDLPPYEAFSLGGSSSVRGYGEGELGSGRSFVQASAEYRFPLFSFIGGALFADFGSDLGTGDNVPGNPAEVRGKPGNGFGVGAGVRIQSPLGPIRIDYAVNDDGDSRIHFGIGERF